jgi:hypothetical protein
LLNATGGSYVVAYTHRICEKKYTLALNIRVMPKVCIPTIPGQLKRQPAFNRRNAMTLVHLETGEKTAYSSNNSKRVNHQSVNWLIAALFAVVAVCLSSLSITANAQTPGSTKPTCSNTSNSELAEDQDPQSPIGPSTMGLYSGGYFSPYNGFRTYSQTNSFSIVSPLQTLMSMVVGANAPAAVNDPTLQSTVQSGPCVATPTAKK